jgi:hypothetical protein
MIGGCLPVFTEAAGAAEVIDDLADPEDDDDAFSSFPEHFGVEVESVWKLSKCQSNMKTGKSLVGCHGRLTLHIELSKSSRQPAGQQVSSLLPHSNQNSEGM